MPRILLSLLLLVALFAPVRASAESAHLLGLEFSDSLQSSTDGKSCSHYSIYRILKYGYGQATTVGHLKSRIGYTDLPFDISVLGLHITGALGEVNIGQPPTTLARILREMGYASASEEGNASDDRIKDLLWAGVPVALLIEVGILEAIPGATGYPVPLLHWWVANGYDAEYLYVLDTGTNAQFRITWYDLGLLRYYKGKLASFTYSTKPVPGYGLTTHIATLNLNFSSLENIFFGAAIDVLESFGANRGSILYFNQPLPGSRIVRDGERFPRLDVNANWGARVESSDRAIDCPAKCGNAYRVGTQVTLFATVPPGSTFRGWSGPCQTVVANACRLTITGTTFVSPIIDCPKCVATVAPVIQRLLTTKRATPPSPTVGLSMNQHGLTGSWYEAATGGQGFEVEVFANPSSGSGSTFVSWFTYDTVGGGAERQRWYTAQGSVVTGQPNAALTIYQNAGGNFNAPPVTNAQAVGTATLSFDTCTSGQLSYAFTDGTGRTGTIPLTRLTQNVTCSTTSSHPTNADFALSGNWYDPATSGQGFTIEVNPISRALFAAWYTYQPNGTAAGAAGQRWYTAQAASFTPGMRSIPVTIYEHTGGVFDTPTPPAQKSVPVGTGTMAFQSCSAATFSYNFTGGSSSGQSGTINLSRVGPVPPGCTT